jgi:16S rRNA processing protein RimM
MTLRQDQGRLVAVGRIAGAFGVRGELKCDPSNAGRTLFLPGAVLRCERGGESRTIRISEVRPHQRRLLLRLEGVDDANAAAAYAGAVLYASRDRIALRPNEYLDDDLVGCAVEDVRAVQYGTVDRVEHYPSSDMLVIGGRMVPMVAAIVTEIDLARRRIVIDPPEGLL